MEISSFTLAVLFLGARYSFRSPDINTSVNQLMDKAQNQVASAIEIRVGNSEAQVE